MNRLLVILGLALLAAGLAWPWLSRILTRIPWGRLPGDINISRESFHFSFPITTCLLVSALLSLILWWLKK